LPLLSSQYIFQKMPHCFNWTWQDTFLACCLTRCSAGIRIDISTAMTAITTSSSMSVNPCLLRMLRLLYDRSHLQSATYARDSATSDNRNDALETASVPQLQIWRAKISPFREGLAVSAGREGQFRGVRRRTGRAATSLAVR